MGREVEVCGECMQGIDKNNRGHARHCSQNASNLSRPGQMIIDRGPQDDRPSPLDDVGYQHKKEKDATRFEGIASTKRELNAKKDARKAAKKVIGKRVTGVEHTSKETGPGTGEWTHPEAVEGTKVIKVAFGGFKIVKNDQSPIWRD